jgi:hypothetical protein
MRRSFPPESMAPELVARSHADPEYATGAPRTQITVEDVRRWGNAFSHRIRVPKDGRCRHSRHCRGCLKQVVRYMELLCRNDREAFCFPSISDIAKHARKDDGSLYKKSIVYDCIKYVLETRMFVRESKIRNGRKLGWTMTPHTHLASVDASWCTWGVEISAPAESPAERITVSAESPAEEIAGPAESSADRIEAPAESSAEKQSVSSATSRSVSGSADNALQPLHPENAHRETGGNSIKQMETVFKQRETDFKQQPKPEIDRSLSFKADKTEPPIVKDSDSVRNLDSHTDSPDSPDRAEQEIVVRSIVSRDDIRQVAADIVNITDKTMSKNQLQGLSDLMDKYSSDNIIKTFRYIYRKQEDDFARNETFRNFFTGGGDVAITGMLNYKARMAEQERRAEVATERHRANLNELEVEEEQPDTDF